MKYRACTVLVLLLGLLSFALEVKKQQTLVSRIRSGKVKIRLQIPSTDFDTMLCLTRVSTPIDHLGVAKCQYVADQFFMYNVDKGTLQSYGAEADGYWIPTLAVPPELQDTFDGKLPVVLNQTTRATDHWDISIPDTRNISYSRKDGNGYACLATTLNGGSVTISAKWVAWGNTWSGWGGCPVLHVLTTKDDEMVGSIVEFRLSQTKSGQRDLVRQCVTFDETAVAPHSALVMRKCVPGAVNQQFTYNIITKHLRTAVDNSALFFWWRGPVKALPDLTNTEIGYGWDLPIRRPGSVVAVDHRGYSGACWSQVAGTVMVEQDCGTFAMLPTEDSYLYRVLSRSETYQSVYVTAQINNAQRCLTIRRLAQNEKTEEITVLWNFLFDKCQFDELRLDQRFVLSVPKGNTCDSASCQGTLRWAGDLNVMVTLLTPRIYDMIGTSPLVGGTVREEYTWNFPYTRFGRVHVSRRDYRHTACVGFDKWKNVVLTGNITSCLNLQATPISKISPQSLDAQTTVIARYDYRSMLVLPNDRHSKLDDQGTQRRALRQELPQHFKDLFQRKYDYFVGDLGSMGIRRFRVLGSGLRPQPSGELRTNIKPNRPNGITLPLYYEDIRHHPFLSIDLYFRVNRDEIQARGNENSFLLMSFARAAGCVVYVTFTGKPGIQCYRRGEVFASEQVLDFPQDLFDGDFHKVSVLFSPHSNKGFIELFIDGQLISHLVRDKAWSMANTGQNVAFFYDPHHWMYQPLPASVVRASVVGSRNYTLIKEIASRKVIETVEFQGTPDQIVKVPTLTTVWRNCQLIPGTGVHYEGVVCHLLAQQDGTTITLPRDVFSLGCSRPGCSINFLPNQPQLAKRYRFIYRPNYPEGFVSENVGDPDLFQDPARLTDGFKTETVSFGLKFTPEDTTDTEDQDNQDSNHHDGTNLLQVGIADVAKYRCTQSCCVRVGSIEVRTDSLTDEIF